jgi:hypothetical protein
MGEIAPPSAVDRKSRAAAMSTVSGRKASISEVSMSPPWMPKAISWADTSPRACRSRPTGISPPASPPAPATRATGSTQVKVAAMAVHDDDLAHPGPRHRQPDLDPGAQRGLGVSVRVPAAQRCSFDLPTACTGRMRRSRSAGQAARSRSSIPSAIIVSVPTGRCGPCCSMAAVGSRAMVRIGSSPRNRGAVRPVAPPSRLIAGRACAAPGRSAGPSCAADRARWRARLSGVELSIR